MSKIEKFYHYNGSNYVDDTGRQIRLDGQLRLGEASQNGHEQSNDNGNKALAQVALRSVIKPQSEQAQA